jgi:hypothetical protein
MLGCQEFKKENIWLCKVWHCHLFHKNSSDWHLFAPESFHLEKKVLSLSSFLIPFHSKWQFYKRIKIILICWLYIVHKVSAIFYITRIKKNNEHSFKIDKYQSWNYKLESISTWCHSTIILVIHHILMFILNH